MTTLVIPFPAIDPVAISLGPLDIRWYALAYVVGFILGWRQGLGLTKYGPGRPTREEFDGFFLWAILGVILGGRIGYVLFYNFESYIRNPTEILVVWRGGMAFHGGLLGAILALLLYARVKRMNVLLIGDVLAAVVPIGLFFGRLANFVNGELWGRPTDVPWAMVFPAADALPRHPSQLYQAGLEGLVLFLVMLVLATNRRVRARPGLVAGVFLALYGLFRFTAEFFREPDQHLGFLWLGATMGQILSMPMILAGLGLVLWTMGRGPVDGAAGERASRTP